MPRNFGTETVIETDNGFIEGWGGLPWHEQIGVQGGTNQGVAPVRGRLETVNEPRREPVTISIDTLYHWPRKLGSLELDEKIQCKLATLADKHIAKLFDDLFPPSDLDAWKSSCRRFGGDHGVQVNGA